MVKILLTTTSYQDTPGPHHQLLESEGMEIQCERGPLSEEQMLALSGDFDAFLCGDDAITQAVIDQSLPKLKIISKYGIGVDKIDVEYATKKGIPLLFCPGVNHTTVAEHTFALMLSLSRRLIESVNEAHAGNWKRMTGHELMGKTIGIVGMGRIGKEVATRAKAFAMPVKGFDLYWPEDFAKTHDIPRAESIDEIFASCDIISLHTNLTEETRDMVCEASIAKMKPGVMIVNCARGELVKTDDMVEALNSGLVGGYGTDVIDVEPPPKDHPLLTAPNCVITPHIGSRTFESVERQAMMATQNLINTLKGKPALAQVNKDVPIPEALL